MKKEFRLLLPEHESASEKMARVKAWMEKNLKQYANQYNIRIIHNVAYICNY